MVQFTIPEMTLIELDEIAIERLSCISSDIIVAMPIFEYRCKKCDHEFEKIVFGTTWEIQCPKCSGKDTEKLLSGFAVKGGSSNSATTSAPAGCGSGGFR